MNDDEAEASDLASVSQGGGQQTTVCAGMLCSGLLPVGVVVSGSSVETSNTEGVKPLCVGFRDRAAQHFIRAITTETSMDNITYACCYGEHSSNGRLMMSPCPLILRITPVMAVMSQPVDIVTPNSNRRADVIEHLFLL
jgi:hypothetical protein